MATLITPTQGTSSSVPITSDSVRVALAPSAGFCIKSVTTDAGFYTYVSPPSSSSSSLASGSGSASSAGPSNPKLLEPMTGTSPETRTLQIPRGVKVFLNIAWDRRVPAPPEASEEVVRRAMAGADLDDVGLDGGVGTGAYYVPVVVSEPREAADKTGKPSVVFDCVFSASLKPRCTKDREFRMYLIELALEHVEEKTHITLSRQVGTPNITSKGKLEARTVLMPRALVDPDWAAKAPAPVSRATPLVQELPGTSWSSGSAAQDKGNNKGNLGGRANDIRDKTNASTNTNGERRSKSILKATLAANASAGASAGGKKPLIEEVTNGAKDVTDTELGPGHSLDENAFLALPPLRWKWGKDGERLKIEIEVPNLTRDLHAQSTLDIEPRRVLLHIPQKHFLDINLDLPDAQIGKVGAVPTSEDDAKDAPLAEVLDVDTLRVRGLNAGETLRLKRQREFDVEKARAEWRVGERKLVISV